MEIKRQVLDGTSTEFAFDKEGKAFLVKNFSEDPVLVNFEAITSENEETSAKIPSKMGQIVLSNIYYPCSEKHTKIYVKGTGEVEVQLLCF